VNKKWSSKAKERGNGSGKESHGERLLKVQILGGWRKGTEQRGPSSVQESRQTGPASMRVPNSWTIYEVLLKVLNCRWVEEVWGAPRGRLEIFS